MSSSKRKISPTDKANTVGPLVGRFQWRHKRNRIGKGHFVFGSYRNGLWSMSSVYLTSGLWPVEIDDDRTHYCRIPDPPNDGVTGPKPSAGSGTVNSLVGTLEEQI